MAFPPLPAKSFVELIAYMHAEMTMNAISPDAQMIRRLNQAGRATLGIATRLGQALPSSMAASVMVGPATAAEVSGTVAAMALWANKVAAGRDWDHKGRLKPNNEWVTDGDTSYRNDIWSNIHYGYVGRAVGFSAWTLKAGAGGAQIKDKTVPPGYWDRCCTTVREAAFFAAFDDPVDQAAIMLGADLYDAKGLTMTANNLRDDVRARKSSLATKPSATSTSAQGHGQGRGKNP